LGFGLAAVRHRRPLASGAKTEENGSVDPAAKALLVEFVEKTALLRRDMQHKGELEGYAVRFSRIEQ
jgi:hypothetical protein